MTREELERHILALGKTLEEAGVQFVIAAQDAHNPVDCAMLFSGPLTNIVGMCEVAKQTMFRNSSAPAPLGSMN